MEEPGNVLAQKARRRNRKKKKTVHTVPENFPKPIIVKEEPMENSDTEEEEVLLKPKIEEISDDEDDGEEYETIWDLLQDWGLEDELRPIFKKYKITFDVLNNLNEGDLKVMIPDEELALRVLFRTKLRLWQSANYFQQQDTLENSESASVSESNNFQVSQYTRYFESSQSSNMTSENLLAKDFKTILKATPKGNQIFEYSFMYATEELPDGWRTTLCEGIADYCIQHKHILNNLHYTYITNEIVKLFPAEDKDTYFTPRITREENSRTVSNPTGLLVQTYNNSCRKLRRSCQAAARYREMKIVPPPKPIVGCTREQYQKDKLWLQQNNSPWFEPDGVFDKWKQTFRFRRIHFTRREKKETIIEQWPVLNDQLGYALIESDFKQIYPTNCEDIITKWDRFYPKIVRIIRRETTHSAAYQVLRDFEVLTNQEIKNCCCFQLINYMLAPAVEIPLILSATNGRTITTMWRPSVREALDSFFYVVFNRREAKRHAQTMTARYAQLGLPRQPFIYGIGPKADYVTEYVVVYKDLYYSFPYFIKAMCVVFKLYHVFNLEYNKECQVMWQFIEKYFFNITKENVELSEDITGLIERLEE